MTRQVCGTTRRLLLGALASGCGQVVKAEALSPFTHAPQTTPLPPPPPQPPGILRSTILQALAPHRLNLSTLAASAGGPLSLNLALSPVAQQAMAAAAAAAAASGGSVVVGGDASFSVSAGMVADLGGMANPGLQVSVLCGSTLDAWCVSVDR
jgi:hypothetical protein